MISIGQMILGKSFTMIIGLFNVCQQTKEMCEVSVSSLGETFSRINSSQTQVKNEDVDC